MNENSIKKHAKNVLEKVMRKTWKFHEKWSQKGAQIHEKSIKNEVRKLMKFWSQRGGPQTLPAGAISSLPSVDNLQKNSKNRKWLESKVQCRVRCSAEVGNLEELNPNTPGGLRPGADF